MISTPKMTSIICLSYYLTKYEHKIIETLYLIIYITLQPKPVHQRDTRSPCRTLKP